MRIICLPEIAYTQCERGAGKRGLKRVRVIYRYTYMFQPGKLKLFFT